jgi:hypothetical protein
MRIGVLLRRRFTRCNGWRLLVSLQVRACPVGRHRPRVVLNDHYLLYLANDNVLHPAARVRTSYEGVSGAGHGFCDDCQASTTLTYLQANSRHSLTLVNGDVHDHYRQNESRDHLIRQLRRTSTNGPCTNACLAANMLCARRRVESALADVAMTSGMGRSAKASPIPSVIITC